VYFGARYSSRAPDHIIRPILVVVLVASSFKLLGVGNVPTLIATAGLISYLAPHVLRENARLREQTLGSAATLISVAPKPAE
jgi:hypothetical protein